MFAILVLLEKVQFIFDLIHSDVSDSDLPLTLKWHYDNRYTVYRRSDNDYRNPLDCFKEPLWGSSELENFNQQQKIFLVPFLELRQGQVSFYPLDNSKIILPFIEYEPQAHGGYGRVWKVKIHAAHHNFRPPNTSDGNPFFAVKELFSKEEDDFKKEVEVLGKFSGPNKGHKHLIRLLLTYRHDKKYYMLFPWASGNLRQYWEKHQNPGHSLRRVHWLAKQCLGIAAGLRKIHRVNSPKNVNSRDAAGF